MTDQVTVQVSKAESFLAGLFERVGLPASASARMGRALVDADVAGLPSHGLSQAEMYIRRLLIGSVSLAIEPVVVESREAIAVLDAQGMFGHLVGDEAMQMAIKRSKAFGVGVVVVRNSFHFGTAARYTQQASVSDCIGIAMCNTKPMMPAPGGREKLVGNNPLSIALPASEGPDFVLDMALSEAALGKIRVYEREGKPIPSTWAVDRDGNPTTDATAAIEGMLLPSGGAKGFGLSLAINLICSLLSQGPGGDDVASLYGDLSKPFLCSLLFLAIDIGHFRQPEEFRAESSAELVKVRRSKSTQSSLHTPGERSWRKRQSGSKQIQIPLALSASLNRLADEVGSAIRLPCATDAAPAFE
ncbi:LDH2 family malate/lactate/ureidoglycolate dehydrogenase [Bradyrhizobium sp. S3.3.6]|uniref:Ldh family oxidoreductase n=1 Tax=Bradyrhizobium sp. S3.3.6 TaxID=3156429 RepID=UPI003395AF54